MDYDVKDTRLRKSGKLKIEWADESMPVLQLIRKEFTKKIPFRELRIAACLHVTSETANLMRTLKAGGAKVALTASNPLSTQDDVAASLVKDYGIPVFAIKGETDRTYYKHIDAVLSMKPHITMDDGADLISTLHIKKKELLDGIIGGTEETTTGVVRLKSMAKKGILQYPIIAVNDSQTKYLFDNRYGTGQSTIDGILRATNYLLAGSTVVIAGYGWCGRGLALRMKGMGANVIVTEVDGIKALEAIMDGFRIMPMKDAAPLGDLFVTLTGDINVIDVEHFKKMKDGAIVANSGHFDVEINKKGLKKLSKSKREIRPSVEEYVLKGGKKVYLLAEGRLVNLSSAEGHPASVMDMSFANQSKAVVYLTEDGSYLGKKVYKLPDEIDIEIARLKLKCLKVRYDKLTKEQEEYLHSWKIGT
ncbi:MAG: adenosylhomocysteinase [Candidatus Cloacimonadota bacterium]|nr:MAG: adenosylhomocysteinase [Candidatus Cloacimonadota bacterium]